METKSLTHRTYDALTGVRAGKLTAEQARVQLKALRQEAGDEWDRIKFAALVFDQRTNG